ncbi:GAF sensor signal transduction histidine kinase [Leeuwenhoekiella aestuarii]|uniref:histidine kinase n=2 Tax=Leeuwenhoekiella aestuarii TaxID=2249426 RepID=A0A4Q0NY50_9FLAO|nr:GAF domain-containing sensor histidine kinase [Leeuwenhoekiella aestuarii]RXG16175.1 GAF sensor signal transduction histidine kinase [Leeuwenhoekiella aestuarii]RXG16868.1 GAF sensor signal transduction histidine kinase [Leeuwenhoekiella aestuarii]
MLQIDEQKRQKAVNSYKLVGTLPEKSYDNITQIASYICGTPIALITMLDYNRNFLKSHYGVPFNESPREISFCTHAIQTKDPIFIIPDARLDDRFKDNPLVTGDMKAIFYAGVPLVDRGGHALGTLCVFDHEPRELNEEQINTMIALASQVVSLFELRRQNIENKNLQKNLLKKNSLLKEFAGVVSHDMKMPLANIITTTDLLKTKYKELLDEKGLDYLNYLKSSSFSLSEYINGILQHYESDNLTIDQRESFDIHDLLEQIEDMLNHDYKTVIILPEANRIINCNRAALHQIFINLLGNSIKYNDKEEPVITVDFKEDESFYHFKVMDNGIGIPEEKIEEIFNLFSIVASKDKNGNRGNGIGLSTVKKLVANLGGKISVTSTLGEGSTFRFSARKENIPTLISGPEKENSDLTE